MNVPKHLTISLGLIALALGLTTVQASAQTMLRGTFELPAAVYWGDTLLQPGQYSFLMHTDAQVHVIRLSGEGIAKSFVAIARPERESGRNYLEIDEIGGNYVVRALDAGVLGESYRFVVGKKVTSMRASAEPAIAVPVSSASGF